MEEEARDIPRRAVGEAPPPKDLGRAIHARFAALGGVDLELPERGPARPPFLPPPMIGGTGWEYPDSVVRSRKR